MPGYSTHVPYQSVNQSQKPTLNKGLKSTVHEIVTPITTISAVPDV